MRFKFNLPILSKHFLKKYMEPTFIQLTIVTFFCMQSGAVVLGCNCDI